MALRPLTGTLILVDGVGLAEMHEFSLASLHIISPQLYIYGNFVQDNHTNAIMIIFTSDSGLGFYILGAAENVL